MTLTWQHSIEEYGCGVTKQTLNGGTQDAVQRGGDT